PSTALSAGPRRPSHPLLGANDLTSPRAWTSGGPSFTPPSRGGGRRRDSLARRRRGGAPRWRRDRTLPDTADGTGIPAGKPADRAPARPGRAGASPARPPRPPGSPPGALGCTGGVAARRSRGPAPPRRAVRRT